MLALAILFCTALIIKVFTKNSLRTMSNVLPSTGIEWLFCIITFAFSAIYEEIIYRFYFADALKHILKNFISSKEKIIFWICEISGLAAFAFAHLYMGFGAVINAFAAHIVLRILYKKTRLIWNCVIIHLIYNIISLILL